MDRIVVTGGSGFIGVHTIEALLAKNYEVLAVDWNVERLKEKFSSAAGLEIVKEDIRSPSFRNHVSKGDKVLHLAAIARFGDCERDPLEALEVNVVGTLNVLMACRDAKAERIVFSSTGSVYSRDAPVPLREDGPRGQVNIYGSTKKMAEDWIFYFAKQYRLPFVILRYGYVYGRGKWHGAIGSFISLLREGNAPTIYGGEQINDFTYVKDIVQANLLALETDKTFQAFNIGSGRARSIRDSYDLCRKYLNINTEPKILPPRDVDYPIFVYDITKARVLLGYEPRWSLEDGIKDMLEG